jgi:hypothetical protein
MFTWGSTQFRLLTHKCKREHEERNPEHEEDEHEEEK